MARYPCTALLTVAVCGLLLLTTSLSNPGVAQTPEGEPLVPGVSGRYQMLTWGPKENPMLVLLDTHTGQAWEIQWSGPEAKWKDLQTPPSGFAGDKTARIRAGDRLHIRASSLPDHPINGVYKVEPSGKVPLGGPYGRVQIKGMTLEEAEAKVRNQVASMIKDPQVSLTWYDPIAHGNPELLERVTKLEKQVEVIRAALAKHGSP
jgi:hypothetical protein